MICKNYSLVFFFASTLYTRLFPMRVHGIQHFLPCENMISWTLYLRLLPTQVTWYSGFLHISVRDFHNYLQYGTTSIHVPHGKQSWISCTRTSTCMFTEYMGKSTQGVLFIVKQQRKQHCLCSTHMGRSPEYLVPAWGKSREFLYLDGKKSWISCIYVRNSTRNHLPA